MNFDLAADRLNATAATAYGVTLAVLEQCQSFDAHIYSDLHKDAYGFRPRASLEGKTAAQLDALWNVAIADADAAIDEDAARAIEAELAFDARIDAMIALGAADRAAAYRWVCQADDLDPRDADHNCYRLGLPFSFEGELAALAA